MTPDQLYGQAQLLIAHKKHDEAYKILKKLNTAVPNHTGILYLLAVCQSLTGHKENAVKTYQQVLKLQPFFIEALNNIGLDLKHLKRYEEAIVYFDKALIAQPDFFDARLNKAATLIAMYEYQSASDILVQLVGVAPNHPMVLANLGLTHLKTRNPQAALEHFENARLILNENLEIDRGYILALAELKKWEKIIAEVKKLPNDFMSDPQIQDSLFSAHLNTCNWNRIEQFIAEAHNFSSPLNAICVIASPTKLLSTIKTWVSKNTRKHVFNNFCNTNKKIKVGYISSEFKSHALSVLVNGVFGRHDPELFEIHGIATDEFPPLNDPYRQKISESCHYFHELGGMDDKRLVDRIKQLHFDILVDLSGHTGSLRSTVLADRCAPIQMQYLGFPATMGASYIDYTIGDPVITPSTHFGFYTEKIISLPECFQANDDFRKISAKLSKHDYELPGEAFVFACFNKQTKFTQKLFHSWLKILNATPNSVLWCAYDNTAQVENLIEYTASNGIDPKRLIFAKRLPYEQHLARYAFADLALDTYPFNGGTTSSDALWGGAPLITIIGDSYSSRMSASLLHSVGLDELVTTTFEDYEKLAIALAKDKERLLSIRRRLQKNLGNAPVFNTERFVKHLETGFAIAVDRHRRGLKPDHIFVPLSN